MCPFVSVLSVSVGCRPVGAYSASIHLCFSYAKSKLSHDKEKLKKIESMYICVYS